MKKIMFWIWTGLVIVGVVLVSVVAIRDKVYSGTDLNFEVSTLRVLAVDATSEVTIEAASNEFFLLRKLSGETVVGTPTNPPLGWDYATYYVAGPIKIQGGQWLIQDGAPTIHLTSADKITVTTAVNNKTATVFLIALAGIMIWLLGLLLAISLDD